MDITRNWRLKMGRSQLLAARHPVSGEVILPQQTSFAARDAHVELYRFEDEREAAPVYDEGDFSRAAR